MRIDRHPENLCAVPCAQAWSADEPEASPGSGPGAAASCLEGLLSALKSGNESVPMSNRALWNVRRRHEWLTTPLKGKRLNKRKRLRIGLQQAQDRKAVTPPDAPTEG